jgi:hypothetical protein
MRKRARSSGAQITQRRNHEPAFAARLRAAGEEERMSAAGEAEARRARRRAIARGRRSNLRIARAGEEAA